MDAFLFVPRDTLHTLFRDVGFARAVSRPGRRAVAPLGDTRLRAEEVLVDSWFPAYMSDTPKEKQFGCVNMVRTRALGRACKVLPVPLFTAASAAWLLTCSAAVPRSLTNRHQWGDNALHTASETDRVDELASWIKNYLSSDDWTERIGGGDMRFRNDMGWTPVHVAVLHGNATSIRSMMGDLGGDRHARMRAITVRVKPRGGTQDALITRFFKPLEGAAGGALAAHAATGPAARAGPSPIDLAIDRIHRLRGPKHAETMLRLIEALVLGGAAKEAQRTSMTHEAARMALPEVLRLIEQYPPKGGLPPDRLVSMAPVRVLPTSYRQACPPLPQPNTLISARAVTAHRMRSRRFGTQSRISASERRRSRRCAASSQRWTPRSCDFSASAR